MFWYPKYIKKPQSRGKSSVVKCIPTLMIVVESRGISPGLRTNIQMAQYASCLMFDAY
jgi:hypothetical protein